MALLTMSWWLLPLRCAASQHPITSPPRHPISTLRAVARSGGWGCCRCRPSLGPLSLSSPVFPPYEQLLVVEGSGAVGVIVSPLSLLSSCPALAVLVLVPLALVLASSSSSLTPTLPVPLLARRRHGDGDRPVSTRSTLRARARSGGRRVLGCGLILVVSAHLAF